MPAFYGMPDFSAIIFIVYMVFFLSLIKPSLYMFIALIIADMELIIKGPAISIKSLSIRLRENIITDVLSVYWLFLTLL